MNRILLLIGISILHGCIGVDVIDDPIVDETITFTDENKNLLIGETCFLMPVYTDVFGIERSVDFSYEIQNPSIASIDMDEITALLRGQTTIVASYNGIKSQPLLLTVTSSLEEVSQVIIASESSSVGIGENLQLSYQAFNGNGEEVTSNNAIWTSSAPNIASIDASGLVSGLSNGLTQVTVDVEGVKSAPLTIEVGSVSSLSAELMGANGYDTKGTAIIEAVEDRLVLTLSEDFSTDFALGTFLYLSNSTSGSNTRAQGLEIAELTRNGSYEFNLSDIEPSISLTDYQYVIVLCKPASITFGFGELK